MAQFNSPTRTIPVKRGEIFFSVEAMMPMSWRGMIVVPANVAQDIADMINACAEYRIGKGRSVRGRGRMIAQVIAGQQEIENYFDAGHAHTDRTAIVLQSPVAIPQQLHAELTSGHMSAEAVLRFAGGILANTLRIASVGLSTFHLGQCWNPIRMESTCK